MGHENQEERMEHEDQGHIESWRFSCYGFRQERNRK